MGFINQLIVGLLWGKKRCPSKNIIDHRCTVGVPYLTSCSNIFNIIIYKHIFSKLLSKCPSICPLFSSCRLNLPVATEHEVVFLPAVKNS